MAPIIAAYSGLTLSFQVRDEAAVSKQLDLLIKGVNQVLGQRPGPISPVPQERRAAHRVRAGIPSGLGSRRSHEQAFAHDRARQGATDRQRYHGHCREGSRAGRRSGGGSLVGNRRDGSRGRTNPPRPDDAGDHRSPRDDAGNHRQPAGHCPTVNTQIAQRQAGTPVRGSTPGRSGALPKAEVNYGPCSSRPRRP